jgi:hypothetical protein
MNLIKLILINLATTIVILILLEIGLRIFHDGINLQSTDNQLIELDKYGSSFGLKENSIGESFGVNLESDKYGFRKSSIPAKSDSNSILIFGDSVTMGIGVESDSTYIGRLADELSENGIGLLNFSLIGYNIFDYINTLKYSNKNYRFNKILLFYCLNDSGFESNIGQVKEIGFVKSSLKFLKSNSYLYLWIKNTFTDRKKAYYDFELQNYSDIERMNKLKDSFLEIKDLAGQKQISVVILPYEYQLRNDSNDQTIQRKLKNILDEIEIEYYDAYRFLKNSNFESNELYLYGDGLHFSELGHKLMYEFISEEILISGI